MELKDFYENQGVKIFIMEKEDTVMEDANPICTICGKSMVKDETRNWFCKTCEYFFGISSKPRKCSTCNCIYGYFAAIEDRVTMAIGEGSSYFKKTYWKMGTCPKCGEKRSD